MLIATGCLWIGNECRSTINIPAWNALAPNPAMLRPTMNILDVLANVHRSDPSSNTTTPLMKTALVENSVYARPNLARYNRVRVIDWCATTWEVKSLVVCVIGGEAEGETNKNINPLATIMLGIHNHRVSGAR